MLGIGAPLTSCTFFARPKGLAQKVELGPKSFMIQAQFPRHLSTLSSVYPCGLVSLRLRARAEGKQRKSAPSPSLGPNPSFALRYPRLSCHRCCAAHAPRAAAVPHTGQLFNVNLRKTRSDASNDYSVVLKVVSWRQNSTSLTEQLGIEINIFS